MPTCPNGHQSAADDWCEVCGHRMSATAPGAVPPPPPPAGPPLSTPGGYGFGDPTVQAELCPRCRTPREAQAPFCEECRHNFAATAGGSFGPPPVSQPQGLQSAPPPPPQHTQPPQSYEYYGSRPSRINRPAEPLAPQSHPPAPAFDDAGDDWLLSPPSGRQAPPPPPVAPPPSAPQYPYEPHTAEGVPSGVPPQAAPPVQTAGWVAVIAPDREYFMAMMNRSGPEAAGLNLPAYSPELRLPLAGHQVTVGRRRHSTGESPDIDLSRPPEDPGVSHQHAMFVQQPDGSWAVVDQDSTNGTTINGSEDPIQPYVPVPLSEGDRVHVGAWTTITLHRG
ncbi:FHA domain-containing protein [Streptomyces albireticuli]|uniref:FHA domain-containing protein n=2 Tax=Streptomyces albireticuli TaxID=1940 RepID=UPI001E63E7A6|nr:FHA domain-containing protein [Streptomyces albireticuli]MCD9141679.1 FHA domain-containing protein [Streptomyces albireticuli]MCD9164070.1 FHA domain-containing protein [Streptomyces albireticuli]MCD9189853.1 FHA domain-containing protein [Streptomyces albireticuli]